MDGILEANFLTQLGPFGIGILALVACYFIWQRVTSVGDDAKSQFAELKNDMSDLAQTVEKARSEQASAIAAMAQQNAHFQIDVVSNRPTRAEMNESLERIAGVFRDLIGPIRTDLGMIKNALMKGVKE